MDFSIMSEKAIKYSKFKKKHLINIHISLKVINKDTKIMLYYTSHLFFTSIFCFNCLYGTGICETFYFSNDIEKLLYFFCYRIVRPDDWEIFPSEVTMDDNIGRGAFGTVFSGHISRDICKKLPYFKLHRKKLGKKGEIYRVAVKRLKGGC